MDLSTNDVPFYKAYFSEIIIVVVIILGSLTLFALLNIDLNEIQDKRVQKIVTIEKLDNMLLGDSICSSKNDPSEINSMCNQLTNKNCKVSSCCVVLNGNKCVGGNADGPTFHSENGEKINVDYYYYKNKCFGNCPK